MELTPNEWQGQLAAIGRIEDKMAKIQERCPGTAALINSFKFLAPGPEYVFSKSKVPEIPMQPAENQEAKDLNEKQLNEAQSANFNFSDPRINQDGKAAVLEIKRLLMSRKNIPDALLEKVVSFETDQERNAMLKKNLRNCLDKAAALVAGGYARNTWIAKNVLNGRGNTAVVVGYNHVRDLVEQIESMCLNDSISALSPSSIPQSQAQSQPVNGAK